MKNITDESKEPTLEVIKLQEAAQQTGLQAETVSQLTSIFAPMAKTAHDIIKQAEGTSDPKIARAFRLRLRETRILIDEKRKSAKDDSLKMSRAIDGMANILKFIIEPVEQQLSDIENAAEIAEQQRIVRLKEEREKQLVPLGVSVEFYKLGEMPQDVYLQFLETSQLTYKAKKDAEEKLEAEKIRISNEQAKEQERIRLENEQLKKDAAEREKKAAEEKLEQERKQKAADAKAAEERRAIEAKAAADKVDADKKAKAAKDAADKVIAEEKKKREAAEEKQRKQTEENERLKRDLAAANRLRNSTPAPAVTQSLQAASVVLPAKGASDKDKLLAYNSQLIGVVFPRMTTQAGVDAKARIQSRLNSLFKLINEEASDL